MKPLQIKGMDMKIVAPSEWKASWGKAGTGKKAAIAIALVVAGFLIGYRIRPDAPTPSISAALSPGSTEAELAGQQVLYICPMVCIPPGPEPGNCPVCGMELVAFDAGDETRDGKSALKLSSEAVAQARIQTAVVERHIASAKVRLYGRIDYDPAHVTKIAAFAPGLLDRVYVKRSGQFVRWGQPLFDIYSEDLLDTQKQLFEAMKYVPSFLAFQSGSPHSARQIQVQERLETASGSDSPEVKKALKIIAGIRHKLSILGLPKRDIDELMQKGEATGIATVYASVYGQVIEQNAFEGTYVNRGTPIFTLADPRYVWVRLNAYEMDYPWLRKGQTVTFKTSVYPGEIFEAKIVNIDPVFNTEARSFSLGAVSQDAGGRLKAGMLVRAEIHARLDAKGNVVDPEGKDDSAGPLVIPATAPLITGKRAVVYVASPDREGLFEGREVTLGPRADNFYIVVSGLKEGERVVKNGSFKIDSALQILARPGMMAIKGGHSAVSHQHPGGSGIMDRDYQIQRRKSREEVMMESEPTGTHDEPKRPVTESSPGDSVIQRRKPGSYGDTTRQR